MFPLNDISCLLIVIIRFKVISFSSFWIILYWLAFDLFGLFFDREAGIGYAAHVGGFVSGLLLCLAMTKWWRLKPSNYEMFLPEAIKCRGRMESKDRVLPEYRQLYNEIRYGIKHKTDDDSSETADGEPDAKLAKPDYAARLAAARQEAAFRVKDGHIVFACDCGKKLRVPVKLTGKQSRCPDCQEVIDIPKVKLPAN